MSAISSPHAESAVAPARIPAEGEVVVRAVPRLNLASQPTRNERLPALVLGLAVAVALLATVEHVRTIRRLVGGSAFAVPAEITALEAESARLRSEEAKARGRRVDAATAQEWAALKDLVDRRTFSWRDLFSRLEAVAPYGVRLVSISPSVDRGRITLQVSAVARTEADALQFVDVLEDSGHFWDVRPQGLSSGPEGVQVTYVMGYSASALSVPRRATAAPSPAPAEGGVAP